MLDLRGWIGDHEHLFIDRMAWTMIFLAFVTVIALQFQRATYGRYSAESIIPAINGRAFIFPLLITGGKPTPLHTFLLAVLFCCYNGYLQGRSHTSFLQYPSGWTSQPNFIIGVLLFVSGMCINIHSDHVLRNLRKPGETGYKIPQGGMFEYVSGANFFGEIVEWSGYALASWSLPAVAFAIFTACNIGPRAVQHHKWYLEKFRENYPAKRKAVIPFIL